MLFNPVQYLEHHWYALKCSSPSLQCTTVMHQNAAHLDICGEVAGDVLSARGWVGEGGVRQGLTIRTQGLTIGTAEPVNIRLNTK